MSNTASDTLEKVSGEFEGEVLAGLTAARNEVDVSMQAARRATLEDVSKILETGARQGESQKRQIIGAAELGARNFQLRALERAVNEVFQASVERLGDARSARREIALEKLIEEGVGVIGTEAVVSCNAKDRATVSDLLKKMRPSTKLTMAEQPVETIGGVILSSRDGSVRFDNTFEARLERMRPDLRKEAAGILNGEQPQRVAQFQNLIKRL